jgi:peptidoglycan/xylan/chitin deacetylase (PgdA/CDA1 family)
MNRVKRLLRSSGLRRSHLAAARICCERNVLASFGVAQANPRARILCYHSVGTPQWGVNDVNPARFRQQIELALRAGYRFVPAEHIANGGGHPDELAVTFDDGLASVATNAAPILAAYRIPWTLFVVSDWADGRHNFGDGVMLDWNGVMRVAAAGATIGSHSVTHPDFGRLAVEDTGNELRESRRIIQARTGLTPATFAIPFGQSTNWSADAARQSREAGYEAVFAQSEQRRPEGTVARTFITSFDNQRIFRAALGGSFDRWEEWL